MRGEALEPLSEEPLVQPPAPRNWIWTWGGVCFGFRQEEWLFTDDGVGVGRFIGDEVYGTNGKYLGELITSGQGQRLIASSYKKKRVVVACSPKIEGACEKPGNRFPLTPYCGFEDFPAPEIVRTGMRETPRSENPISYLFKRNREATPNPTQNTYKDSQVPVTSNRERPRVEPAVVIDATALDKYFSSEPQKVVTGSMNMSNKSSQIPALAKLTQPAVAPGEYGQSDRVSTSGSQVTDRQSHIPNVPEALAQRPPTRRFLRVALVLLAASLVTLALILLGIYPFQKPKKEPHDSSISPSVRSISTPQAVAKESLTNRVEVKALEPSWISAIADGKSFLGRLLTTNDTWTFDFSQGARLHLGNAGGVEVKVNGQSIGPLGSHGLVRDVELTPDPSRDLARRH